MVREIGLLSFLQKNVCSEVLMTITAQNIGLWISMCLQQEPQLSVNQQPERHIIHPHVTCLEKLKILFTSSWDALGLFLFYSFPTFILLFGSSWGGWRWERIPKPQENLLLQSTNQTIPISTACSGFKQREWTPWINRDQVSSKVNIGQEAGFTGQCQRHHYFWSNKKITITLGVTGCR